MTDLKFERKVIDLIFSLKEKSDNFDAAIRTLKNDFYDVSLLPFWLPIESKCLGEILSTFDIFFSENYGLEYLANSLWCQDTTTITINDRIFDLKIKEEIIEMLKFIKND